MTWCLTQRKSTLKPGAFCGTWGILSEGTLRFLTHALAGRQFPRLVLPSAHSPERSSNWGERKVQWDQEDRSPSSSVSAGEVLQRLRVPAGAGPEPLKFLQGVAEGEAGGVRPSERLSRLLDWSCI